MLNSRADLTVDLTFVVTLLAPFVALTSFRLAHTGRRALHRVVQLWLLAACVLAVLGLETRIRLAGGSGAFLSQSPFAHRRAARLFVGVHISAAVLTYLAWGWLAIWSQRRWGEILPGPSSHAHRRIGWLVFGGLAFTALSASGMYWLVFVSRQ
jgi:hypothetical protein